MLLDIRLKTSLLCHTKCQISGKDSSDLGMAPRGYRTCCDVHKKSRTKVLNKHVLHAKILMKIPLLSLYPLETVRVSLQNDQLRRCVSAALSLELRSQRCQASIRYIDEYIVDL